MSATRPPESQGYGFVPLCERVRRQERPHARLDQRVPDTLSGWLDIELVAEQPVFMGTGHKRASEPGGRVIERGVRILGVPGIQGSSFKGALRSRYEAITRSCAPVSPDRRTVDSKSRSTGIKHARLSDAESGRDALRPCSDKTSHLCPACALFGRMSRRARIAVTDLASQDLDDFVLATMPGRFSPRLHHAGECRETWDHKGPVHEVTRVHGRKFAVDLAAQSQAARRFCVESMPAGTRLAGRLRVTNVTAAELGGLLATLGRAPESFIKIGGGKAHGFGQVRTAHVAWTLRDHRGQPVAPEESRWSQAFAESADRFADGMRELLALHRGARP